MAVHEEMVIFVKCHFFPFTISFIIHHGRYSKDRIVRISKYCKGEKVGAVSGRLCDHRTCV